MSIIEMTLPYPPSINHYWRHAARKIRGKTIVVVYVSAEGEAFRKSIKDIVNLTGIKPLGGAEIFAEVFLYPTDKRKRDVDNIAKALFDALQEAGVYQNDCQITRLYIEKRNIKKGGEVLVRLHSLA